MSLARFFRIVGEAARAAQRRQLLADINPAALAVAEREEARFLPCDLAVRDPITTPEQWTMLWMEANEARAADGLEPAKEKEEAAILLTAQTLAQENGMWMVRADGAHRRPTWWTDQTRVTIGTFLYYVTGHDQTKVEP